MSDGSSTRAPGRTARKAVSRRQVKRRGIVRYSPAVAEEICERIARGEKWFQIAGSGRLPEYTTAFDWVKHRPDFAEAWAQARAMAADLRADKVLVVAEEGTDDLQRDRLHVSALKWHVGRAENPKGQPNGWNLGKGRRLVIRVREFERAYREDGTPYVREITAPHDDGGAA